MVWTLVTLAVVVIAWYWFEGNWNRHLFTGSEGSVCNNLNGREAGAWLREHPETQVLDMRSVREFQGGSLPNAVNISIGDPAFDTKIAALDKERPVLVYCAGGFRSRKAVLRLKQAGFRNIQHIHRGYLSWKPEPAA